MPPADTDHYRRLQRWEVFARHGRDAAIAHLGDVRAADADDAEVYAYTMYDERRWTELLVVPHDAVVPVVAAA